MVVVGAMGLPGAVVAEGLSELAVCLLEAAVCPLEALSRSLMGSTVVELVREESMEAEVEGLTVTLVKVLKVAVSPVSMSAK